MQSIKNNLDFVELFENQLCEYTGFSYAACVDCCTSGIFLSLEALRLRGEISKTAKIELPKRTYASVPMTLENLGWKIEFVDSRWMESYQLGDTGVYDAATHFERGMAKRYRSARAVCVSFQQKKRLPLQRGGVVFTWEEDLAQLLRKLRHDGRDPKMTVQEQIDAGLDFVRGWHCYLEPAKAALGINLLNQSHLLRGYEPSGWLDYPDLSQLECLAN